MCKNFHHFTQNEIFLTTKFSRITVHVQCTGTVNREYFDVKIFSDSMACAKIKCTKYMRNINDNAVQGRLSENYLMRKIIARDMKYSRFTVAAKSILLDLQFIVSPRNS